jgi:glutamate synthase domain-containing protein 3
MSGGIAYVYDTLGTLKDLCNHDMVSLERPDKPDDVATIRRLLENHAKLTDSPVAKSILGDWDNELRYFVKVMPNDYRRVLEHQAEIEARAAALSQRQDDAGEGDAAGAETLVTGGLRKGGSDVGEGNH